MSTLSRDMDRWIEKRDRLSCRADELRYHRTHLMKESSPVSVCVRERVCTSRSFGINETQQLREGQLVGRMLPQRLATGATRVKQASVLHFSAIHY